MYETDDDARAERRLSSSVSPACLLLSPAQEEAERDAEGGAAAGGADRSAKKRRIFPDHLRLSELTQGLREGKYHQGSLRVSRFNPFEGSVGSDAVGADIFISGRTDMNRAMEGDTVVVELLPEAQWRKPSSRLPGGKAAPAVEAAAAAVDDGTRRSTFRPHSIASGDRYPSGLSALSLLSVSPLTSARRRLQLG